MAGSVQLQKGVASHLGEMEGDALPSGPFKVEAGPGLLGLNEGSLTGGGGGDR